MEVEKAAMGMHFKLFKHQIDVLHRQVENFVDLTGTFPVLDTFQLPGGLHGTPQSSILPTVEFDSFELNLIQLLTREGSVKNEPAMKAFVANLKSVKCEEHKALCLTALTHTRSPALLAAFSAAGGFKIVSSWMKMSITTSFLHQMILFLSSPGVKLEKRLDKDSVRVILDAVSHAISACCSVPKLREGGIDARNKLLSKQTHHSEEQALRKIGIDFLKRLRLFLNTAEGFSDRPVTVRVQLKRSNPPSASETTKRTRLDDPSAAKVIAGGSEDNERDDKSSFKSHDHSVGSPSSLKHQVFNESINHSAREPLREKYGDRSAGIDSQKNTPNSMATMLATAKPNLISEPPSSSAYKVSTKSAERSRWSTMFNYHMDEALLGEKISSDQSDMLRQRRTLKWADEEENGALCTFREFEVDSFDEADAGLSDALVPDEHGRSADHLEDCHSSNITAMKKKEHERERLTLEQSRKEMYPDPIAVTSWKPPKLRKSSSILERDATDSLASIKADISVDSKELKIQKLRHNKRLEAVYLLTTEIPNDPELSSTLLTDNTRAPVNIPWVEDIVLEHGCELSEASPRILSIQFYCRGDEEENIADAAVNDSACSPENGTNGNIADIIECLPESVKKLSFEKLSLLIELLSDEQHSGCLENPLGQEFCELVEFVNNQG